MTAQNGGRIATPQSQAPADLKSLTQPPKLSTPERAKMKAFLDQTVVPFKVLTAAPSKKRKRGPPMHVQDDLWNERLSVAYEVQPREQWERLRKYRKLTVGSESITTGEYVLVKHDESESGKVDVPEQWKAKVLEVRALDSEHVYVRVAWMNRPEDLPGGRKPYHGKYELIPSNQMDVIDASTINGQLDVQAWDDGDDESAMLEEEQYFYRQTYDFARTKSLSKLRLICIDNAPTNPEEMIIQCSNSACRKWMHVKCISEKAVRDHEKAAGVSTEANTQTAANTTKKREPAKSLNISPDSQAIFKSTNSKRTITAEVFIKGLPADHPEDNPATSSDIVVTDASGERHRVDLLCLHCSNLIMDE